MEPSPQLNDLISAKDTAYGATLKKNPTLRLFYVTTGSGLLSTLLNDLVQTYKRRFGELNIFNEIEINSIGARQLQEGYRFATNSIKGRIEIIKPITLPEHASVQQAFLGLVDARELVELATHDTGDNKAKRINRAVFFDNIRDFDANSKINLGILAELKDGGQASFVFKNNGVTVVAREIKRKGDTFELDDFQIVNGCQTTNLLFLAGERADGVQVPFRLIGSNDPNFVASIIVGTNKQNKINDDQFWALTPFLKNLEEFSRSQDEKSRIFIERRENQYREEAVERTRICRPRELVKAVAAMFLFQPHRAARDYHGIVHDFRTQLFQDNHSVTPYHAAALASYWIDFAIRNSRVSSDWGLYKYYVMTAIGCKATSGQQIFKLPARQIERASREIISLVSSEKDLTAEFKRAAQFMGRRVGKGSLKNREKVRDFIRSDSLANEFVTHFSPKQKS